MTADMESEELDALRRMVVSLFAKRSSETDVRHWMATDRGLDLALWRTMADLGLTGMTVPQRLGGSGASMNELAVVMEEAGKALACVPLLSSSLATVALLEVEESFPGRASTILGDLAQGRRIVTLATSVSCRVTPGVDGGWNVSGMAKSVLDGALADTILILAEGPDGSILLAVDANESVSAKPLGTLDQTRKLADLEFRGASAELVAGPPHASSAVAQARDAGAILLASEQVGGAQAVLDMSVAHATSRMQFGRPIGSFQAVKHRCADMLVDVELARTAARYAVAIAADDRETAVVAATAASFCAEAFYRCATGAIQVHGGVGFTWEHPAHLYLKRAMSGQHVLGTPRAHRRRIAAELGWTSKD
ncbi:acyl-CoA dehydrogenase family protein [Aeromicrobium panaciterrae]|uniref:acyl-CoA dehydrogenase family protein n=1 Tax=Aeromicrobium panaciterrae TaxID=363861 RepID=UPI0031D08152